MFKTVAFLHLFVDLLTPVGKLSECLQGDTTNLLHAKSSAYSERLQNLICAAKTQISEGKDSLEFQSVSITGLSSGVAALESSMMDIVAVLTKQLSARFSDVLLETKCSNPLLGTLKVLNPM